MSTQALEGNTGRADADLVRAASAGDSASYGELVERYKRMLFAIAWSRIGHAETCEDVVQDAFVRGYKYLRFLRQPEKFPAWLARITRNLSAQALRDVQREKAQLQRWAMEKPAPAKVVVPDDSWQVEISLQEAMSDLTNTYREVLVLYYTQGKSVRDGARALGISESAFKTRLHRARRELKDLLDRRLEESLRTLQPKFDTRARVMTAVANLTPISGSGNLLSFINFLALAHMGLFGLFLAWSCVDECRNYRSAAEMRRKLMIRELATVGMAVLFWIVILRTIERFLGFDAILLIAAVLVGIGSVSAISEVRIAPHSSIRARAVGGPFIVLSLAAMAFRLCPPSAAILGFLPLFLLQYLARRQEPRRKDYNLFQRAAMGAVCSEMIASTRECKPHELFDFGRFLGARFLIADHYWSDGKLRLFLRPVAVRVRDVLLPVPARWQGASYIEIGTNASCYAHLAQRDRDSLRALIGHDPETAALERQLSSAVETSLAAFLSGDLVTSIRCVQMEGDDQVFAQPPHKLTSTRVLHLVLLVLLVIFALHFVWRYAF